MDLKKEDSGLVLDLDLKVIVVYVCLYIVNFPLITQSQFKNCINYISREIQETS